MCDDFFYLYSRARNQNNQIARTVYSLYVDNLELAGIPGRLNPETLRSPNRGDGDEVRIRAIIPRFRHGFLQWQVVEKTRSIAHCGGWSLFAWSWLCKSL